jgi:NAD(P)H dehydrogenase (quinone)
MTQVSADDGNGTQRHVVVLCHPDGRSFNAAVAQAYCEAVRSLGHEAILRDLYRLGFDPVLRTHEPPAAGGQGLSDDVTVELDSLRGADILVLVYPIWFGTPPAMLKGYVDRVLGAGFSYRAIHAREPHPLVGGMHLLSVTSSGSSSTWLDLHGAWSSLRNVFDNYLAEIFSMASNHHLHLESVVQDMSESLAREKLQRVEALAADTCARLAGAAQGARTEKATAPS